MQSKITKHSAFTTLNGINKEMGLYEQRIMDISEEEVEILHQHNGISGKIVWTWSKPFKAKGKQ